MKEDMTLYQYFMIGNLLGISFYSIGELYKYFKQKEESKDKLNKKLNEKLISMRGIIKIQLEEIEEKKEEIKKLMNDICEKDIIIDKLNKKNNRRNDKIIIEYEDVN
tara:strand:+ start:342 stop:662 length:321 start_codon:yes stop_codon:yes gene_type:complete